MTVSVFIDGAVGTTGLEIRDRLAGRAEIALLTLDETDRKDLRKRAEALNDTQFVILCLPDDAAREAVALIDNPRTRVIDASSAHRTAPGWVYGFPELEPDGAERIADAARVSNPGCWPTGFLALLRPLIRAGLVPHDWPLAASGASGYSGGGKAMIAEFEGDEPAPAFRSYALGLAHKHVAEMRQHAGLKHPPLFAPAVAHTYRGMIVEVLLPLHRFPNPPELTALHTVLRTAYQESPLIRIAANTELAAVNIEADAGTDRLTLHVLGNLERGQARLIATLDNLGKGAAGAAVQNLNIMAGLDPVAGLVL